MREANALNKCLGDLTNFSHNKRGMIIAHSGNRGRAAGGPANIGQTQPNRGPKPANTKTANADTPTPNAPQPADRPGKRSAGEHEGKGHTEGGPKPDQRSREGEVIKKTSRNGEHTKGWR